jgi:methionyl-tRNA synthetase
LSYKTLASHIGNLLNRISALQTVGKMSQISDEHPLPELDAKLATFREEVDARMEAFQVTRACEAIMDNIGQVRGAGTEADLWSLMTTIQANRMFTDFAPWYMSDPTIPVVYVYTSLRIAAILLQPIMPNKSAELLDRLGVPSSERKWENAAWRGRHEVDPAQVIERLRRGRETWRDRGHLFPKVLDASITG